MKIAIVGLGYVGLPLALAAAKKGNEVVGIDVDIAKIDLINKRESPFDDDYVKTNIKSVNITATNDFEKAKTADTIVICVPTPVDERNKPDLSYLEQASKSVAKILQPDQIVIVESTVYPGTTKEIVKPILDKANVTYFLAHCPERIDPGNKKWTVENIPRVIGGINKISTQKAAAVYEKIIDAKITIVKSSTEAEATKIMENTFRDVNIAFVNEMAKSFHKAGIDIMEVIKGASTKPFGFMPHYPGCGVGGHCIAVDPYYLIDNAKTYGFDHEFLKLARKINDSMPAYTVGLLEEELKKEGKHINGQKVGLLGVAYKKNVDDTRNSPTFVIKRILEDKGAIVSMHDPFVRGYNTDLDEFLKKNECFILCTDHTVYKYYFEQFNMQNLFIDGKNALYDYKGIGK